MIRLRAGIQRASHNRWLWPLVVLLLALLLVLVAFHHGPGDALDGSAVLTCVALLGAVTAVVVPRAAARTLVLPLVMPKAPPGRLLVAAQRVATRPAHSFPLRR